MAIPHNKYDCPGCALCFGMFEGPDDDDFDGDLDDDDPDATPLTVGDTGDPVAVEKS